MSWIESYLPIKVALSFKMLIPFLVLMSLLFTSCGLPGTAPNSFLSTSNTSIAFIQWTNNNGQLSGQLEEVSLSSNNSLQTQQTHAAFTGTLNGSQVSLNFGSFLGIPEIITGTFDGNTLTLAIPEQNGQLSSVVFNPASIDDYNKVVSTFEGNIAQQANNATATVQTQETQAQNQQATATTLESQQQAVTYANNALSSALSNLQSDTNGLANDTTFKDVLQSYANDWQQMQKDYQQEQTDAQGGCNNVGTVGADDGTVGADYGSIGADDGSFQAQKAPISNDISIVQQDIQTVQSDWQQLQNVAAANTTGSPAPAFSSNSVNKAVQAAQNQIASSQAALKNAQTQTTNYDNEAKQLKQQADALVANMHCA